MRQRPLAALLFRKHKPLPPKGKRAAKVQHHIHRLLPGVLHSCAHIVQNGGFVCAGGHGAEHGAGIFPPQGDARGPRDGEMCGKVFVCTMHARTGRGQVFFK